MTFHAGVPQVGHCLDIKIIKWLHQVRLFGLFWGCGRVFYTFTWKAASLLFMRHVRNLAVLISEVGRLGSAERPALCDGTGPLADKDVRLDVIQQLSGRQRNGVCLACRPEWERSDFDCADIFLGERLLASKGLTLKYPYTHKSCISTAGAVQQFEEWIRTEMVFEGLLGSPNTAAAPFFLCRGFMHCNALVVILPPLC